MAKRCCISEDPDFFCQSNHRSSSLSSTARAIIFISSYWLSGAVSLRPNLFNVSGEKK